MRKIYLDNASTTNVHPDVMKTYVDILSTSFCNVDALYDDATKLQQMMEKSRNAIAKMLNVTPAEVIFTSGASESNSFAIKGCALKNQHIGKHIITTAYEHSSVMNAMKQLEENFGFEVTYLKPNEDGIVTADMVKKVLRKDTVLVSIMYVNNEVGAINPVDEIGNMIKMTSNAYYHVDGVQALGKLPIVNRNIDLMSFSAHKIEGLKGSGLLLKKRHVALLPLINGGQQEYGIRGGTSNAATNICFAKTLRLALENQNKYHDSISKVHDYLIESLLKIEDIEINSKLISVDNIINFSNSRVTSEVLMNALNAKGIMVSALSTCHSKENMTSHVLKSMGYSDDRIKHSLRVSFDYHITLKDIDDFMDALKEILDKYG